MPTYACRACGATNSHSGDCILCGADLGSLPAAALVAFGAAAVLGVGWVGWAWLTGLQVTWFAAVYGGLVSGALVHFSGGRGPLYQGVATAATVLGLLLADSALVALLAARAQPDLPLPPVGELLAYQVQHDPITIAFMLLGVAGGLWVWRYPADEVE